MKFQGKIKHQPSSATDPIPWLAWLYVDDKPMDCRWRGTRDEAFEALAEMRSLYLERSSAVMIDLPDGDFA